ncbi:MAG: AAA family ATPase [Chitinophagales bacterium]|nr:AAA family ATPase [Chitinophagales bacterium]
MKNYKFKSLRVFASDEWLANRTRNYRTVFERMETTYISGELSFYNKLFDQRDWECVVTLKAFMYSGGEKKEICSQEEKRRVRADENIVYIHKGWGNSNYGLFWTKGEYCWEAYIDGELVGSRKFYIEDAGKVSTQHNPYFDLVSVRLFSGGYNAVNEPEKRYLKKISRHETKYLYVELKIKNKLPTEWNCEIFFKWYNSAGLLKAHIERLRRVEAGREGDILTFNEGWGNDIPGTWKDSAYRLEIVFMDTIIAVLPLETGEEDEEGDVLQTIPAGIFTPYSLSEPASPSESLEAHLNNLDQLVGLEELKEEIKNHIKYLNFLKLRQQKGFSEAENISLHSVFTGNPGTGKTTVVKMLGQIYRSMGLLSRGHVKEVDRSHLIGEYIGQTAPKVKKALEEAAGGILFIDEAYSLAREADDSKDFGREAIEVLVKEMSDGNKDIAIMVAGYPREMENFLDSNPGLKSRFNHFFHFDDYVPEELYQIALLAARQRAVTFSEDASKFLFDALTEAFRNRDRTFGNARFAHAVVEEAKKNLALRLMQRSDVNELSNEQLSLIELQDIKKVFDAKRRKKANIKVNEKLLRDALSELNQLVGIKNIKEEINELVRLVRFYEEEGKDVLNRFSLHSVFIGNPGTGKTTVARIVAKIFKALGLLERGHTVEVDRQGLVAGYLGQTAIKTDEVIKDAKGGVLFIDEAYSLGEGNDYGREAIETLIKRMEDYRGEFAVIVAGYTEPMERFLNSNPGFKSRFDRTFNFNDYTVEELIEIALSLFKKENLTPDEAAYDYLKNYIRELFDKREKHFGNAREIRKLVERAVQNQHLRLASLDKAQRTNDALSQLTVTDLQDLNDVGLKRKRLGFKY